MSGSRGRSRSNVAKSTRGSRAGRNAAQAGVEAHGWALFAHPCFLDQLDKLISAVERERKKHPDRAWTSANAKVLAAIAALAFDEIPRDPARMEYRQGGTLGRVRKHWFRAKFGGGRFRLVFRFRSDVRVIVYAWVNDEETLRTYGSRTDAYAVFGRMLDSGNPPNDWDELLAAARSAKAAERTRAAAKRLTPP